MRNGLCDERDGIIEAILGVVMCERRDVKKVKRAARRRKDHGKKAGIDLISLGEARYLS
jgi:hypothetical protein